MFIACVAWWFWFGAQGKKEEKPLGDWGASKEKPRARTSALFEREQEMAIYSLLHGRDTMAVLSTGFGNSMIFTVFLWAKKKCPYQKPV